MLFPNYLGGFVVVAEDNDAAYEYCDDFEEYTPEEVTMIFSLSL